MKAGAASVGWRAMNTMLRWIGLFVFTSFVSAQTVIPLWPDGAPGALGKEDKDVPSLTVFPCAAETATGAAMVIFRDGR